MFPMILRRRRSSVLIAVTALFTLGYFLYKDDKYDHIAPRKFTNFQVDGAVKPLYFDPYDSGDDDRFTATNQQFKEYKEEEEEEESDQEAEEEEEEEEEDQEEEGEEEEDQEEEEEYQGEEGEEEEEVEEEEEEGEDFGNFPDEDALDREDDGQRDKISETRAVQEKIDAHTTPIRKELDTGSGKIEGRGSGQAHLLILAYMRTGSSMTGRILQYSPDVFYWYEPLHELERYYVTGGNIKSHYRNLTLNEWFKSSAMAGGNISATLSCDIAHVYAPTLYHYFMNYGTYGTRRFYRCFQNATSPDINPDGISTTDNLMWDLCVANTTRYCLNSYKATAAKSIRLHMSRALEVMKRDPEVKVVHLVRDPRGVLLSRNKLGFANFNRLKEEAALLCGKYTEDLDLVPPLGDPLRDRYKLVRYEDIAGDPITHTQFLYKLMNLEPTTEILASIRTMTSSAKKTKPCPTCPPIHQNSTEVAQAWRKTLSFEDFKTISQECAPVMRRLGYRVDFADEAQLRDIGQASSVETLNLNEVK